MEGSDEFGEELISRRELSRLREEVRYWQEQCARAEQTERALIKRYNELGARLEAEARKEEERLRELQSLEAQVEFYEWLLKMRSQEQGPGRDSSHSGQRGEGGGATQGSAGACRGDRRSSVRPHERDDRKRL